MVDHDLMFLRNVIHGAPVGTLKVAARLRALDVRLNESLASDRQIPVRNIAHYLKIAERLNDLH